MNLNGLGNEISDTMKKLGILNAAPMRYTIQAVRAIEKFDKRLGRIIRNAEKHTKTD